MSTIPPAPLTLTYHLCDDSQSVKEFDSRSVVGKAKAKQDFETFLEKGRTMGIFEPPPHVVAVTMQFGTDTTRHEIKCKCQLSAEQARGRRAAS